MRACGPVIRLAQSSYDDEDGATKKIYKTTNPIFRQGLDLGTEITKLK